MSWNNVIYTGTGYRDFHNVQHSSANVTGGHVFNTAVFDTRTVVNSAYPVNNDPTNVSATSPYNPDIQPTGNNYRTFPQYLLRQDYTSNWDATLEKGRRHLGKREDSTASRLFQPAEPAAVQHTERQPDFVLLRHDERRL